MQCPMQCLLLTPTALRNLSMRLASLRGTEFGSLLSTNKKIPTEHLQRLCGHDSIDRRRSHQSQALTWLARAQSRLETGAGGAQHGRLWLPLGQGPGTYPALRTCLSAHPSAFAQEKRPARGFPTPVRLVLLHACVLTVGILLSRTSPRIPRGLHGTRCPCEALSRQSREAALSAFFHSWQSTWDHAGLSAPS